MTAVLSTNLRSPDLWDVYAIANELLASLVISSKYKSDCVKNRSQRQSRPAAVQFLSVMKIHNLSWLSRLNCHMGNELMQLSGDNDQTAATAIHICGYHKGTLTWVFSSIATFCSTERSGCCLHRQPCLKPSSFLTVSFSSTPQIL